MKIINLTFWFFVCMFSASSIASWSENGEAFLIHSVPPIYPTDTNNLEGWVEIQFDINATGMPINLRVTGSEPAHIFNRAALKSVVQWRYKPAYKDGVPVIQHNNTVRIEFRNEDP